MKHCLLLVVVAFAAFSTAQAPPDLAGLRVTVHQSLFDEVNKLVPEYLHLALQELAIPDLNGTFSIPVLGEFGYWLSDIQFEQLALTASSTDIESGDIVENVKGLTISLSAAYKWEKLYYIHTSDHGTVNISISGAAIGLGIAIGELAGHPSVKTDGPIGFSVGSITFDFHGSVDWIYNDLAYLFESVIENEINSAVPTALQNAINVNLESALANLQINVPYQSVILNLTLMAPPDFEPSNGYMDFELKGEFEDRYRQAQCPYTPVELPVSLNSDMIEIYAGQYVLDCAALVYYNQGQLDWLITPQTLPANSSIQLNTTFFQNFIPNLYTDYPNDAMELRIFVTSVPVATISPADIYIQFTAQINVSVILPNTTIVPAFALGAYLNLSSNAFFNGSKLFADFDSLFCNITLLSSEIGDVPVTYLNPLVEDACQNIIPGLFNNDYGKKGFEIPTFMGFEVSDPILTLGPGYLGISSSVQPTPP